MKTPIRTQLKQVAKELVGASYSEQVTIMTEAVEVIAKERNIAPYSLSWHTPINNN